MNTYFICSTACISLKDLATNFTLNELAKASSAEKNVSGPFRMEDFDYSNPVIVEQMMENWKSIAFTGITVRIGYMLSLLAVTHFFSLLFFQSSHYVHKPTNSTNTSNGICIT